MSLYHISTYLYILLSVKFLNDERCLLVGLFQAHEQHPLRVSRRRAPLQERHVPQQGQVLRRRGRLQGRHGRALRVQEQLQGQPTDAPTKEGDVTEIAGAPVPVHPKTCEWPKTIFPFPGERMLQTRVFPGC